MQTVIRTALAHCQKRVRGLRCSPSRRTSINFQCSPIMSDIDPHQTLAWVRLGVLSCSKLVSEHFDLFLLSIVARPPWQPRVAGMGRRTFQ